MTIELKMPALSPTMEKGTLAKWVVAVGDTIQPGDLLAEIETDKATMEFEAIDEGRIASILVAEGTEDVAVGTAIALISSELELAEGDLGQSGAAAPIPEDSQAQVTQELEVVQELDSALRLTNSRDGDVIRATPLARRIAGFRGIPLSSLIGSGPNGIIVKADLGLVPPRAEPRLETAQLAPVVPSLPASIPPVEGVPMRSEKLTTMRKTIARRLSESKSTVPHFYLTARCNLDSLLTLRNELNRELEGQGIKLSVNDFLTKALALALHQVPAANVQFGGESIHHFERVDVSMAVAVENGLVTPVIRNVGAKSLSAIAAESKALSSKARNGELTPEDYAGGTVSLSNLGMFGIDEIVPVINPPQALILGVGAGIRQPWDVDGEIALATIMSATASFDHRAIDGATGAQFLAAFRDLVENPYRIVL